MNETILPGNKRLTRVAVLFLLVAGWTCILCAEEVRITQEAESEQRQVLSDFSRSLGRGGV